MYMISAVVLEISRNSIVKNSCLDLFGMFSLCVYLQWKGHFMLTFVSLPAVNIFLNQRPNILKPMWKWFSTERLFIRWKKFQTNRLFKILSTRNKYDSEVKVKNNSKYSTKIYLNGKQLSFFILNGEKIMSSVRKTTFYPKRQKSCRINWATNENDETILTPGARIYSKLIGHNNI